MAGDRKGRRSFCIVGVMQTQRYECTTGGSNKFWTVTVKGSAVTTTWGKIGSDGQSKTQSYGSPTDAAAEAQKLINAKLKGKYVLVSAAPAKAAKPSAAPKTKATKSAEAAPKKAAKAAPKKAAGEPILLHTRVGMTGSVTFTSDGERIAVRDMPIKLIDLTGKKGGTIGADDLFDLIVAPDGAMFGQRQDSIVALDGATLPAPVKLPKQSKVVGITKDRIGAVGWDTFAVFDRKTGKQLVDKKKQDTSNPFGGKLTPDGRELLAADMATVQAWNMADGKLRTFEAELEQGCIFHDATVSADGAHIVAFAINSYTASGLVAWNAKTGKHAWTKLAQPWFESTADNFVFALSDGRFVTAGGNGVAVWSSEGELVGNLKLGNDTVTGAESWSLSPDGSKLACVWKENFVRVFDIEAIAAGGIRTKTKPLQ